MTIRTLLLAGCLASAALGPTDEATAPRLRSGAPPAAAPLALGGGEVALELRVDPTGAVTEVETLRATPPFTAMLTDAVASWRFEPASVAVDGHRSPVGGRVLVVAVVRPPSLYSGPAPGSPTQDVRAPSAGIPRPVSLGMPVYPPMARGDGTVMIEIVLGRAAEPAYRVITPTSGFDDAALAAVRGWRFASPAAADEPPRQFVYAVLGFREPVASSQPRSH